MSSKFSEEYEEHELIGRGNFGAASLVTHRKTGEKYVSKKIILHMLKEKQQQSALLEANLLRQLKHDHIVSYKASYVEKGVLIIVMEYWEVGDLAYHIKKK